MPFDTIDEVIDRSNATEFGLSGAVWTQNVGKAHRMARELQSGTVWVNSMLLFDPAVPFGGYKMSGFGHEMGQSSLDEYLNVKSVWIDTA